MALTDEFVCTEVRFKFWNSKKIYIIDYVPAIKMWFVYDEEPTHNCLAKFEVKKSERHKVDKEQAGYYLDQYFDSIRNGFYVSIFD